MSDALVQLFSKAMTLDNDSTVKELDLSKYSDVQQAQVRQWLTLSQRFPGSLSELNDTLRETTYLLGTQEATPIDSIVFGRAKASIAEIPEAQIAQNRHIFRWADLIQHVLKLSPSEQIKVNVDLDVPREIKEKPKKGDKGDKDAKDAKAKDTKEAKKEEKKDDKPKEQKKEAKEGQKTEKKEKKKKEQPKPAPARAVTPGLIDLRVGFIQKAVKHPDADSLYVSTIDVGEEEPRTICSGLVKYVPIEDMQQRYVVVVANLKPVKMRGIASNGMVLCASDKAGGVVEFVNPPKDSKPGDRLFFEDFDEEPETQLNPKKKQWEQIQPDFTTTDEFEVAYKKDDKVHKLVNKKGEVLKASTLRNANVS